MPKNADSSLLIRDSLHEDGKKALTTFHCRSPDIILIDDIKNANAVKAEFSKSENWKKDPNINNIDSKNRYIYAFVRVKNIGEEDLKSYVKLFFMSATIQLERDVLMKNRARIISLQEEHDTGENEKENVEYTYPLDIAAGQFGVAGPFRIDTNGVNEHCCFVMVASTEPEPSLPTQFADTPQYTDWIKDHPNIGTRNVRHESGKSTAYTMLYEFSYMPGAGRSKDPIFHDAIFNIHISGGHEGMEISITQLKDDVATLSENEIFSKTEDALSRKLKSGRAIDKKFSCLMKEGVTYKVSVTVHAAAGNDLSGATLSTSLMREVIDTQEASIRRNRILFGLHTSHLA